MRRNDDRKSEDRGGGGNYFAAPKSSIEFIHSGCRVLDCTLAGGWPLGRVVNVVGDKSTGKTLLAIEAMANFFRQYPKGDIFYREAESAFQENYARALGMPKGVDFGDDPWDTIEQIHDDLLGVLAQLRKRNAPGLYIIDSLDALSDEASLKRNIRDDSYNLTKQKQLGELFRRLVREVEESRCCFMVISQIRENIGVRFGEKYKRTGGKSLDFYASQVLWLAHLGNVVTQVDKAKRTTGVDVLAKCKKNKIGLPFRSCEFEIKLGYGIDDLRASIDWLMDVGRLGDLCDAKSVKEKNDFIREIERLPDIAYKTRVDEVGDLAERIWREIDTKLLPTRSKYT